jgi:hypothetical protein
MPVSASYLTFVLDQLTLLGSNAKQPKKARKQHGARRAVR